MTKDAAEQYVVRSRIEQSDQRFRFPDLTKSICVRRPGYEANEVCGCWLSTVGAEPFAPGFEGLVVVERFISDLELAAGDQITFWYGGDIGTGEVVATLFANELDPTEDELRTWADSDAMHPMQDWDLVIWGSEELGPLFVQLAEAGSCRQHKFFLHLLYGRVGDAVRASRVDPNLLDLVDAARESGDIGLITFTKRADELIADPSRFDYDDWCGGGLSNGS